MQRYHRAEHLESDPLRYLHRYAAKGAGGEDLEVLALVCSSFAYGSVGLIFRALDQILKPLGDRPARYLKNYNGAPLWPGFSHRFHKQSHLQAWFFALGQVLRTDGTLKSYFRKNSDSARPVSVLGQPMQELSRLAAASAEQLGFGDSLRRGLAHLTPSSSDGSACKRGLLFLRWLVRGDAVDFGLWKDWMDPADLLIPIDTHIAKLSHYLGLREGALGQAPSWKMAEEITESLRAFCADDPVRYDFALTRLGILDHCQSRYLPPVCTLCPVFGACRLCPGQGRE